MANTYMQGIFIVAAVAAGSSMAPAALVAKYDFNDQNATTATDSAGTAQNGTINGGATYAASPVGGAGTNYGLSLDGVNDYVGYINDGTDSTLSQTVSASDKYTIEVFVNNLSANSGAEPLIFGQDFTTVGLTYYNTTGYGYAMGGSNSTFAGGINSGYRHIVVTYDRSLASNELKVYLDGALINQKNFGGAGPDLAPPVTPEFRTGRGGPGDPNSYLSGLIDEIRYYDEALSGGQIAASFSAGPTLIPEPASIGAAAMAMLLAGRRVRKA